jgi:polysaccharide pyruvyl transferase WcaK-like protein
LRALQSKQGRITAIAHGNRSRQLTTLFNLRSIAPNIGNDLISIGTRAMLRAVWRGDVNFVTLAAGPREHSRRSGLTSHTVYELNQLAEGLIVGPGNLFENGALSADIDALSALNVPMMLFGVSTGRVFDRTGALVARTDSVAPATISAVCRAASPVLVRDGTTARQLSALGVESIVVGCPSLFLHEAPLPLPARDASLADAILISIRNPARMSIPMALRARVQSDVRGLIDFFRNAGSRVYLLCHDYQDIAFAKGFVDTPLLYTEDPYQFLAWLRDCRLNVGFRLHAFLCCVSMGVPSIPISYDERAMSLIDTVGLASWNVDFIRSADVLREVTTRCDTLDRLERLKDAAKPVWENLRRAMTDGIEKFAGRVEIAKQSRIF